MKTTFIASTNNGKKNIEHDGTCFNTVMEGLTYCYVNELTGWLVRGIEGGEIVRSFYNGKIVKAI